MSMLRRYQSIDASAASSGPSPSRKKEERKLKVAESKSFFYCQAVASGFENAPHRTSCSEPVWCGSLPEAEVPVNPTMAGVVVGGPLSGLASVGFGRVAIRKLPGAGLQIEQPPPPPRTSAASASLLLDPHFRKDCSRETSQDGRR
jgi:hypothetical protein